MPVAGNAQVVSAPDIGAELEGVIALNLCPVVDELILVFILNQRAIATVHAERIAETEQVVAVSVDEERRHAGIELGIRVQAGDSGVLARAVVPMPFGWPKTLYRNQPKRKSVSKSGPTE